MRFPDREQEQLLKTNENLSETLLASLLDVNVQINMLDQQQIASQRDEPKSSTFQEEWKQVRTELPGLRASLEQFLLSLQQHHCSFPHQSL